MVEDVERVATQLQAHGFADRNALKDRQVGVEELRAVKLIPRQVAELARLWIAEAIPNQGIARQPSRTCSGVCIAALKKEVRIGVRKNQRRAVTVCWH